MPRKRNKAPKPETRSSDLLSDEEIDEIGRTNPERAESMQQREGTAQEAEGVRKDFTFW